MTIDNNKAHRNYLQVVLLLFSAIAGSLSANLLSRYYRSVNFIYDNEPTKMMLFYQESMNNLKNSNCSTNNTNNQRLLKAFRDEFIYWKMQKQHHDEIELIPAIIILWIIYLFAMIVSVIHYKPTLIAPVLTNTIIHPCLMLYIVINSEYII